MRTIPFFTFVAYGPVALSQGQVVIVWKLTPISSLHHLVLSPGRANCVDLVAFHSNHSSSVDSEHINMNDTSHLFLCRACSKGREEYDFHVNGTDGYIKQLPDVRLMDILHYRECRLSCHPNASFQSQLVSRNVLNGTFLVLDLRWFVAAATALLLCLLTLYDKRLKHRRLALEKSRRSPPSKRRLASSWMVHLI